MTPERPLHIVHIVFRFDFGGLENGLVNLINTLPADGYRHTIIALTSATEFARRIQRDDVVVHELGKRPGKDPAAYLRLFRLLRELGPDVVHTRNLGTLDTQAVAWAAGVPHRIHGEHGWDVGDPHGESTRGRVMRRLMAPFVHDWVALSGELARWLEHTVGIDGDRIVRICNGVDPERFQPDPAPLDETLEFGSVTRFSEIKDPLNVLEAFIEVAGEFPAARLTLVGDGPLLAQARTRAREADVAGRVRFAGSQLDVVPWLQQFHVFVLGSRREGISNTILEAMSCGLPVIATDTGGNGELVAAGTTGELVPPRDSRALARAMRSYLEDHARVLCQGNAARRRILEQFSIERMVEAYDHVYRPRSAALART